jgi:sigma-B regulation protein RsbU (phosphoserine phosphatase)
MVMIRTIMRLLSSTSLDAATMTRWINRGVVGSVDLGRFATFSIVAYDPRTRTLEYANAGHLPVMLYRRRTESVETLHADGLPIGIEASAKYQTHRYTLQPGDVLIMYTDGIVEAKNAHKDEFGWERLEDVVRAHHEEHAQELVDAIASRVAEFRKDAPQNDDQTLLAMKVD